MNMSLYHAAAGMDATSRWQELISENLASQSLPGYKKQDVDFHALFAGRVGAPTTGAPFHTLPQASSHTDFSKGAFRQTNFPTDMALGGPGFFSVQLPNGNVGYTRDGEFHMDSAGALVTKQGYPVLGEDGPITLDPNGGKLGVSATGSIFQNGQFKSQFKIVTPSDPSLLSNAGGGYFQANNPKLEMTETTNPELRQGYLELANTNTVSEMTHLISAMRLYEANHKVIQTQDERMGRTISDLGATG